MKLHFDVANIFYMYHLTQMLEAEMTEVTIIFFGTLAHSVKFGTFSIQFVLNPCSVSLMSLEILMCMHEIQVEMMKIKFLSLLKVKNPSPPTVY